MSPKDTPLRPAATSFDPWKLLVDSVLDYAIFMLDPSGVIASWNRGAALIKGYEPQEIIGKHFSTFYTDVDLAASKPDKELEIAARDGRVEDEGWRLRKDGSRFWASVVITALRDPNGELYGFAKVTRDLTARRLADDELRRSEERFRLLIDAVSDYAIYMLDPDGAIATWNRGAERLKGYKAHEVIGRHIDIFFTAEDAQQGRPTREIEIAKTTGRFEEESYRVRKDGTQFWANVVLTPVFANDGRHLGFAKVTRDLTSRVEATRIAVELAREQAARAAAEQTERAQRQAARSAEEANRVKDEFLATVSHELRTPLSSILGWAGVLKTARLEPDAAKAAAAIHRNAVAQSKIIEDILDVSRIITGKLAIDSSPVDMTSVLQHAIEVVRPAALAKQIAIEVAAPTTPCMVLGDADRLQQVAWNLLSNAIKFTDVGGRVRVSIACVGTDVRVEVSDTGQGIAPDFLPEVFERFRQADSSSTRQHGGLGLGLSIVRQLVELHGGRVEAHSTGIGHGATFTLIFPRHVLEQGRSGQHQAVDGAAQPATLSGLKVLVVDDEEDSLDLAALILARAGAKVQRASSAAAAIDAVRSFHPHVLVSDLAMPGEDGFSLVRRVALLDQSQGGGIPSIALTAYAGDTDRKKALAKGFSAHIAKPLDPDGLVAAVARLASGPRGA